MSWVRLIVLFLVILSASNLARAQGTAFSYQGRLNNNGNPASGNLAGVGSGGDVNFYGDDGAQAISTQGGMGGSGGGAGSGGPNSGTIGRAGYAPGGGASGAGCPTGAANNGAAGAAGSCVVRW